MRKELAGRVFVVTGANAGIGRVTAEVLARRGGRVILACRSKARAQPVVDEIRKETKNDEVRFVPLDLASLASVQACAQQLLDEEPKIHVLINNAGVAGLQGQTEDGFELAFGVNHVGHFLLTQLLLPRIKASGQGRIVNVASKAHYKAKGIDWGKIHGATQSYAALDEYQMSKLANILFTKELARRLEGSDVTTYALHPGVVASSIWKRVPWGVRHLMKLFMISNEEGALTTLHCALSDEAGKESGLYYDLCKPKEPSAAAKDAALAKDLWEKTEKWVQRFSYVNDDTPEDTPEPEAAADEPAPTEKEESPAAAEEATIDASDAAEADAPEESTEASEETPAEETSDAGKADSEVAEDAEAQEAPEASEAEVKESSDAETTEASEDSEATEEAKEADAAEDSQGSEEAKEADAPEEAKEADESKEDGESEESKASEEAKEVDAAEDSQGSEEAKAAEGAGAAEEDKADESSDDAAKEGVAYAVNDSDASDAADATDEEKAADDSGEKKDKKRGKG